MVLEDRSRDYVEHRIRAGVLEQGSVDLLVAAGVADRMKREGAVHTGIELQFDRRAPPDRPRANWPAGAASSVYGQTEIVKDLIAARLASGAPLLFEVEDEVHLSDVDRGAAEDRLPPRAGEAYELVCDVVAGCDGFHGVCRGGGPARRALRSSSAITRSAGSGSWPRWRPPPTS